MRKIWCKHSTLLRHQVPVCTADGSSGVTGLHEGPPTVENNCGRIEGCCLPRQACLSEGSALHQRGTEEKKGGGFHQPADDASPESCWSNCFFCSSSCSTDSFCKDRTIRAMPASEYQTLRRENVRPGGESGGSPKNFTLAFYPKLERR